MKFIIFFAFLVGFSMTSASEVPCWNNPEFDGEYKTSQEGILKSYLLSVNLGLPKNDAEIRFENRDFRFVQVGSYQKELPGLKRKELVCTYGYRYIKGTSDGMEGKEHAKLIKQFRMYAEEYNIHMQSLLGVKP